MLAGGQDSDVHVRRWWFPTIRDDRVCSGELRDRVDAALAGVAHVTEHVGSTAVPGLDAKPVIDLDVVVPDDAAVRSAIGALAAAGGGIRELRASGAGRRSRRRPMPSITTYMSWWRGAATLWSRRPA